MKVTIVLVLLVFSIIFITPDVFSQFQLPIINMTISTDKEVYYNYETVKFECENYTLELDYSDCVPSWANPYRVLFNGKLFSYKSFNGLMNKANYFIIKY